MTVGMIIFAVALILGLWTLVFEVNRVGNALWQMQADLHDIRCSISTVGEPAHKLLKAQLNKQATATPDWQPEIHAGPNPFSDWTGFCGRCSMWKAKPDFLIPAAHGSLALARVRDLGKPKLPDPPRMFRY